MSDLPPLTPEQISVFLKGEYDLANWGVFYLRGLINQCGQDEKAGEELRAELAQSDLKG